MGRSTRLGHGSLSTSLNSHSAIAANNYVENNSRFNLLIFYALDEPLPGELENMNYFDVILIFILIVIVTLNVNIQLIQYLWYSIIFHGMGIIIIGEGIYASL